MDKSTSIAAVDKLTVWVVTDNYYDANRPNVKNTHRYRVQPGRSVHAEHGISFYLETMLHGASSTCMFDFGLDPQGVMNNLALLGIDAGRTNAFCLSHGHYDHYTAAVGIFRQNQPRIAPRTPFYIGVEAFARRYSLRPGAVAPTDLGQLHQEDIEAFGLRVVEVDAPVEIIPGVYSTGRIERLTSYEKVPPSLQVQRRGTIEPDIFPGEQALFCLVKGHGLVVLTGCAHAGIVNTVRQAQKIAGRDRVHAIIGGFHLINARPEIIRHTVADIQAMQPDLIVPAHCTGFEAIVAFSQEMPNEFVLNTAATRYTFPA